MAASVRTSAKRRACLTRMLVGTALVVLGALVAAPALAVNATKTFTPSTIASGGTSQLRIGITGSAAKVSFSDTFPAGMTWVPGSPVLSTCGPVTIDAGGLSVTRGTGQRGCAVEVTVTATASKDTELANTTSRISYVIQNSDGTFSMTAPGAQATLTVIAGSDVAPAITSACPGPGEVGTAYAFQVVATGRPVPSVAVTGLPSGLALAAGGALAGTPSQAGEFPLAITAANGVPPDAVQRCTLSIRRARSTLTLRLDPVPAVSGQTVTATARVAGGSVAAQGSVELCVVDPGYACPPPLGAPGAAPTRPTLTAALDAQGVARFTLPNLRIDNYLASARYAGDAGHEPATAGPVDAFVIKGTLLGAPKVALAVPGEVAPGAAIEATVNVTPVEPGLTATGAVALRSGGQVIATGALARGHAVLRVAAPTAVGTFDLTAEYAGDGAFPPATSESVAVGVQAKAAELGSPIPTLSDLALVFTSLALFAFGAHRLRRRNR